MPRQTGCRTGQKHKKRKVADPATEQYAKHECKMDSLQAAAAAAKAAALVAEVDDEAVRMWLDSVLKQVIKQVSADEAKQGQVRRWRICEEIATGDEFVEFVVSHSKTSFQRIVTTVGTTRGEVG